MSRNFFIDTVKAVAALFVICIHTSYPSAIGEYIVAICRIAVPLFLLISGYYYPMTVERNNTISYYKKILVLTFFSSVFYFIVNSTELSYLKVFRWDKMLIFSFPVAGDHLWYLYSLINVLIILAFLNKIKDKLFYLIPLLLFGNYILSFSSKFWLYRNFLFTSLPYFLLGIYFYKNQESIIAILKNKTLGFVFIIGSIILQFIEVYFYKCFDFICVRDHYLMTSVLVVMIFAYTLTVKLNNENVLSVIGKKYSSYIYILHIFVLSQYTRLMNFFNIDYSFLLYIRPLIIFLLTLFMLIIVSNGIHIFKRCYISIRK